MRVNRKRQSSYSSRLTLYLIKKNFFDKILRPYATVYFCYYPFIGAWFAVLSWCSPRTAFAGLFSLLCTLIWGKSLSIKPPGDLHLVNGLLCGLFLSAYYPLSPQLLIGLAIVTLFITISVNWLCHYMWYMGRVPLMTFPFVLGSWLLILVFQATNAVMLPALIVIPGNLPQILSFKWSNEFFSALGGLMLVPYPLPGFLIFLGLLRASRYIAFLAVTGYSVGVIILYILGYLNLGTGSGYNFILVSIALGGIFMVPSFVSFLIAMGGSILAALFVVSLYSILHRFDLPLLIMPFLLSTYFWIGGLGARIDRSKGTLNVDSPVSPEIAWENYRLNKARGIYIDTTPVIKLFEGEWFIEYDALIKNIFFSKKVEKSDADIEICSPTDAIILSSRDGEEVYHHESLRIILNKGWGCFLLLRDRLGQYIFLSHLKSGSIKKKPGEWCSVGQAIALCGKSIDQSKYCIYLQIQKGVLPSSDLIPYHLVNVLNYQINEKKQFNLFYQPKEGDFVQEASRDETIATALHLPPGLKLNYRVTDPNHKSKLADLQTGMTPLGQPRLYASRDRSVGYDESALSLVLYDRQGNSDIVLDLWILSLGLSPLTNQAEIWYDKPALYLWPLNSLQRLFLGIVRPLGVGCESEYTRSWDSASRTWTQSGAHRAHILPGIIWEAKTLAVIDPSVGVKYIKFKMFGRIWEITFER